jgi:hypothetical protein
VPLLPRSVAGFGSAADGRARAVVVRRPLQGEADGDTAIQAGDDVLVLELIVCRWRHASPRSGLSVFRSGRPPPPTSHGHPISGGPRNPWCWRCGWEGRGTGRGGIRKTESPQRRLSPGRRRVRAKGLEATVFPPTGPEPAASAMSRIPMIAPLPSLITSCMPVISVFRDCERRLPARDCSIYPRGSAATDRLSLGIGPGPTAACGGAVHPGEQL